jgi:hypothetical protein
MRGDDRSKYFTINSATLENNGSSSYCRSAWSRKTPSTSAAEGTFAIAAWTITATGASATNRSMSESNNTAMTPPSESLTTRPHGRPKTEHHAGRGQRIVPMLPQVEKALAELQKQASSGELKVFPKLTGEVNLRTGLLKLIARAGLKPWPKLWQNLRASAATDFANNAPAHVAAKICGHSERIAQEHYWQATDTDLTAAAERVAAANVEKAENLKKHAKQKAKQPPQKTEANGEVITSRQVTSDLITIPLEPQKIRENADKRSHWEALDDFLKWAARDSNPRPSRCKRDALTN